jgi:hypothetical protein
MSEKHLAFAASPEVFFLIELSHRTATTINSLGNGAGSTLLLEDVT